MYLKYINIYLYIIWRKVKVCFWIQNLLLQLKWREERRIDIMQLILVSWSYLSQESFCELSCYILSEISFKCFTWELFDASLQLQLSTRTQSNTTIHDLNLVFFVNEHKTSCEFESQQRHQIMSTMRQEERERERFWGNWKQLLHFFQWFSPLPCYKLL